jgi:hypothetical protein
VLEVSRNHHFYRRVTEDRQCKSFEENLKQILKIVKKFIFIRPTIATHNKIKPPVKIIKPPVKIVSRKHKTDFKNSKKIYFY